MPLYRQASDAAQGDVKLEAYSQPLYDQAAIASGASVTIFFMNANGRSLLFTNMESSGSLTWPKRFNVKGFRLVPNPAGDAAAVLAFHANGFFKFRAGEKDYLTIPNWFLTPGVGYEIYQLQGAANPAAPTNTVNYAHNGRPEHGNIIVIDHPIWIPSVQNFRATIQMEATYAPGVNLDVWVMLEGEYFREIQ